jgi:hypothetical protein
MFKTHAVAKVTLLAATGVSFLAAWGLVRANTPSTAPVLPASPFMDEAEGPGGIVPINAPAVRPHTRTRSS